MRGTTLRSLVAIGLGLLTTSAARATPTLIEDANGKRVLDVYEKTIDSDDTKKTLLYLDGNDILINIHDPAILVVDDDDVRHSPAGVKIATFDGEDIRHADRGKVIINYHHPDICPDSASNRIFHVDGPELTRQQLVAVLYVLKPDLFKLTDAETAEQQKAIAEAGAESDRLAAMDQVAGKWDVLNGSGPVPKIGKGGITFAPKKGEVYPATFDFSAGGGPAWMGVAAYSDAFGDKVIWSAFGTSKTIGLCVYDIDGGTLSGHWYPWYVDGDAKNVGTEVIKGPASLDGDFKIESAAAPTSGAAYSGTVSIKPLKIVGAGDSNPPYSIVWTMGTAKVYGIGIRSKNRLFIASGAGPDVNIGRFKIDNGSFSGDFFKLGATEMGSIAASKTE